MAQIGVFTPERAREIDEAVRKMGDRPSASFNAARRPLQNQPVYRVKITGAAVATNIYPGLLMYLDTSVTPPTWVELGECYAYKVDTI